jgi:uncharacterized protein (DUF1800 family)
LKKLAVLVLCSAAWIPGQAASAHPAIHMPYAQAGLTARQAAAHLLSRFSFGATPGEVDAVAREGLDRWFGEQLDGHQPDVALDERLHAIGALSLPDSELSQEYLAGGQIKKMGVAAGIVSGKPTDAADKQEYREKLRDYAISKGYHLERELIQILYKQKLLRAVYSHNQLTEVLTDFWFNHFNVSRTNGQARVHILSYERDSIRPNVFGTFRRLLGATAKSPAMLYYLNNAESVAPAGAQRLVAMPERLKQRAGKKKGVAGLNENYARELMELHTLGVDGGYTQHDVEQVARALTGWTTYGRGAQVERFKRRVENAPPRLGIIQQGNFYFIPFNHDAGAKTILGQSFPAGHGLDEGERVLDILAQNRATALFLAHKLAVRFVGDHPDEKLVQMLAHRYLATGGDLTKEYVAIVDSPAFWAPAARRAKVKTAFEYVVSSLRALDAQLVDGDRPRQSYARSLSTWLEHMGQPIYGYQAPTGFPDRAEMWVSSGSIVNRINFAFALVAGRLAGVRIDRQPLQAEQGTTIDARLKTLAALILPGRDAAETVKFVKSAMHNPNFFKNIDPESGTQPVSARPGKNQEMAASSDDDQMDSDAPSYPKARRQPVARNARQDYSDTEKIVGILISSPEFQRR